MDTNEKNGKFITLDGVDGSGKTIQVDKISEFLNQNSIPHLCVREPGSTEFGEQIRNIVLYNESLSPLTEVFLFFAARNELLVNIIIPAIKSGQWVICDRFYDSTLVYQGIIKGVDIEDIMKIKHAVMRDFEPDLTFIFDVNMKTIEKRIKNRPAGNNKFESMDIRLFQEIIQGYQKIAKTFPFRCAMINAGREEQLVFKDIKNLLVEKFQITMQKIP